MKQINENDFENFTIAGNGWNITLSSFKAALKEWNNGAGKILFGNKKNGTRIIIDSI